MTFEQAKIVLAALMREEVEYVLIGSMGMAAQGLVRGTRDMDLFVSPSPENVERLRASLKSVFGGDASVNEITAADLAGDYPAIQYAPPGAEYSLDIISRLGDAFRYEDLQWEEVIVDGVRIRVATPAMLYRMKKDTVRPQDRIDAEWIRRAFGLED